MQTVMLIPMVTMDPGVLPDVYRGCVVHSVLGTPKCGIW